MDDIVQARLPISHGIAASSRQDVLSDRIEAPAATKLASMVDRNGNTLRLIYDARGDLERVTDPTGRQLRYEYQDLPTPTGRERRLTRVTGPLG